MCNHRWIIMNGGTLEYCVDCAATRRPRKARMSITEFIQSIIDALQSVLSFLSGFTLKGS